MASQRRVLYVGITSRIEVRVRQHKLHKFGGFTAKYNVTNLVYFERYGSVGKAIRREKEVKSWRREKKIELIESNNPKWRDLSSDGISPRVCLNFRLFTPEQCHSELVRRRRTREEPDDAIGSPGTHNAELDCTRHDRRSPNNTFSVKRRKVPLLPSCGVQVRDDTRYMRWRGVHALNDISELLKDNLQLTPQTVSFRTRSPQAHERGT